MESGRLQLQAEFYDASLVRRPMQLFFTKAKGGQADAERITATFALNTCSFHLYWHDHLTLALHSTGCAIWPCSLIGLTFCSTAMAPPILRWTSTRSCSTASALWTTSTCSTASSSLMATLDGTPRHALPAQLSFITAPQLAMLQSCAVTPLYFTLTGSHNIQSHMSHSGLSCLLLSAALPELH